VIPLRIALSGGGTGGHVYPALAIAQQCLQEDPQSTFLYIGTNSGLEKDIVAKCTPPIPFEAVAISGFRRKLMSLENVKTIMRFIHGTRRAKKLLRQFKPDVVVGTGGYVCGPVLYAAAKLGIPTLIHEQNVIPGLTNKFLSRYVSVVAVSFKGGESQFPQAARTVYTGNPRATSVVHADAAKGFASIGLKPSTKLIVIVGGSGGAKAINDAMADMVPMIEQSSDDFHYLYITGQRYYESAKDGLASRFGSLPANVTIAPYIHNMPEVLAAAKLIVNRAGASFLAEIMALGLPSILVPSPNVTNNHQEHNARWLAGESAAEIILEKELTGILLYQAIHKIMDNEIRWEHMSKQARKLGQGNSAALVTAELKRLCHTPSDLT
jgi:UDP-N-acetylglucosamine--N-acetylmuramyl-(pentapeptide) pyrophosphoryl-undecaprenol N-acetylglucosamine transferase